MIKLFLAAVLHHNSFKVSRNISRETSFKFTKHAFVWRCMES